MRRTLSSKLRPSRPLKCSGLRGNAMEIKLTYRVVVIYAPGDGLLFKMNGSAD